MAVAKNNDTDRRNDGFISMTTRKRYKYTLMVYDRIMKW